MRSLEDKLKAAGNPLTMLREAQTGRYAFPIPSEFTHWVEEMRAWRESVALMDQSFHMTDLYVKGPDVKRLLSDIAVNSFANFGRDKAKQLVCVNPDGFVIGDAIVFGLEDDEVNIVGRPILPNWVQFKAETGGYDVSVTRDQRSLDDPDKPRLTYRYEIQGPNAIKLLEAINESGPLTTKFFAMGEITIAGCKARTLSHGMGGSEGLEIFGPVGDAAKVKGALIEAGKAYGLRQVGSRAYAAAAAESGWVPSPLPAIYSGESMRAYREWLPAASFEGAASIGGSYVPDSIDGYYLTPWDLDYGRVVKFDHDFVGRAALEKMAPGPHRRKVTLVWNRDDVLAAYRGLMEQGDLMPKVMEIPAAHYAAHPYDQVTRHGRMAGISIAPAYSPNVRAWISLAILDADAAETGTEVVVTWGEPGGGTSKPPVERHRQIEVRAEVHPWPIDEASRRNYRKQT
jgi:vanillate/3-O-methylgallate O-demethylase